jgi:hypothetical protein
MFCVASLGVPSRVALLPLFVLAFVGCRGASRSDPAPIATTPVSAAPAPPPPPPEPKSVVVSAALAQFSKDILQTCTDFSLTFPPGTELDAGLGGMTKMMDAMMKGRKDITRLAKPCTEQFSDRVALAQCDITNTLSGDGGTADVSVTDSVFDVDLLTKNDAKMRDCIANKGDWKALPKTNAAYRDAVLLRGRRNAERLLEENAP